MINVYILNLHFFKCIIVFRSIITTGVELGSTDANRAGADGAGADGTGADRTGADGIGGSAINPGG